ncbi:MAG: rhomboid family intramembrane serine protease [Dehalococcoidia bacterium]|nr:rhomboid family intramembrane serine protease [Dehalococcoidia bacterium]
MRRHRGEAVFPIRDLNPTRVFPVVTFALIAVNLLLFFFWQPHTFLEEQRFLYRHAAIACELTTGAALSAAEINSGTCSETATEPFFTAKRVALSAVTSMFLHGSLLHVLGNMWFLYLFGNNIEEAYGRLRYLAAYLIAGLGATLAFVLVHPDSTVPLVGASGAIAGVLGAYLVLYPRRQVLSIVFFVLLPVPAALFLGLWFVGQFMEAQPGVAWEAHVAGFVLGAAATLAFRARLLARVRALHRGFA